MHNCFLLSLDEMLLGAFLLSWQPQIIMLLKHKPVCYTTWHTPFIVNEPISTRCTWMSCLILLSKPLFSMASFFLLVNTFVHEMNLNKLVFMQRHWSAGLECLQSRMLIIYQKINIVIPLCYLRVCGIFEELLSKTH